ncbi:helix-turn-helix domain-containing protein [Chryseobacterium aquaticum]|uniref:Helix-turn-helix domain-containing protein n=1 Tax=Chryseobacterium aquaticum TaxID=452084 RepID=A0A848N6E3_9FLAO|nr:MULTISPECIES: helix-turn-helix domain-containing protein [Chryseobacterium]NMR34562.1 helix-turn-helix domain-containing protein [Chryseobacterium aquaticum]NRQ46453.1 helix-turn-helix domain-containing protein [Chryseobacterium sp. C-204]
MKNHDIFSQPDYKRIYKDIVEKKFPDKSSKILPLLKDNLTVLEIIKINVIIFGKGDYETHKQNQMHKSYDEKTILHILKYQKDHKCNNIDLAKKFDLSRNTITKWKRIYGNKF